MEIRYQRIHIYLSMYFEENLSITTEKEYLQLKKI